MRFLLDTNVVSEIRRGRDPNVAAWASAARESDLYLSVLTPGEIRKGIERLRGRDPVQAGLFDTWLDELFRRYADRILAIDARVTEEWGRLNAPAERKTVEHLIAATARVHDLAVVTRNTADFDVLDVALINPWAAGTTGA